jgi:hypothetical protein
LSKSPKVTTNIRLQRTTSSDLLGVEFVVGIRRHKANKLTTIGADTTAFVGRLGRVPGTPLVPYDGGYIVRYPVVDAESHNG